MAQRDSAELASGAGGGSGGDSGATSPRWQFPQVPDQCPDPNPGSFRDGFEVSAGAQPSSPRRRLVAVGVAVHAPNLLRR